MNLSRLPLLLTTIALLPAALYAQPEPEPSITIKTRDGVCSVSGTVKDERHRDIALKKLEKKCGTVPREAIAIEWNRERLPLGWTLYFDNFVAGIDPRRRSMTVFRSQPRTTSGPALTREMLAMTYRTLDGSTHTVRELASDMGVVFFFEPWSWPARNQLALIDRLHRDMPNLKIVGISSDDDTSQTDEAFVRFIRDEGVSFPTARGTKELFYAFSDVSEVAAVPQVFLLRNGRVLDMFMGASEKMDATIEAAIRRMYSKR